jgi:hypothetical protein
MKKIKYILLASVVALGMTSCNDFGDTNIDPENLNETNVPYAMVFSNAQHQALGSDWDMWRTGCIYSAEWTQQLSSIDWWHYYARYEWSDGYSGSFWDTYNGDRGAVRDVTTCYDLWKEDPERQADYNMARVMRIYMMAKMSDLYGDIPYSEAGRPKLTNYPKYDKQEDIYTSMLAELQEAQANLASGQSALGAHDLYYQGDVAKWKKFANSLMLRLAMRLVKVNPTLAKQYAAQAVANGVMTSNADNCKLDHVGGKTTNDSSEPFAKINAHEDREFYLAKTFVDMLKQTKDARLCLIGTVAPTQDGKQYTDVQKNSDGLWTTADYGNMSYAAQDGMPVGGYSNTGDSQYFVGKVDSRFNNADFLANYGAYFSSPNRCTYADPEAPTFVVTYAQTCFLMAEAAQRGYISGDAATYYNNGVKAAFEQYAQFPDYAAALSALNADATVGLGSGATLAQYADAYLQANPFNAAKALEQINTQYYINTFGDPHEVFANWRRSGFPALQPAAMAKLDGQCATDGSIPRRFRYPTRESQVNKEHYDAAVTNMGGDTFSTRMWWDKE